MKLKEVFSILKVEREKYIEHRGSFFVFFIDPRFRVNVYLRLGQYLHSKKGVFAKLLGNHFQKKLMLKYGFHTAFNVTVGLGLKVVHLGGINIHGNAIIGDNFTVLDNVSIGQSKRKQADDVPTIGNDVYVGSSSKIVGRINVGSGVTVGTLTLVNKDVGDGATVVGIPAEVLIR